MANVSIKCIFCKKIMPWREPQVLVQCDKCPAAHKSSTLESKFRVYLDDDFNMHEIVVSFDDGLVLNAAWGKYSPQNIAIVDLWETDLFAREIFRINIDIRFNPDCEPEELHQKVKMWLTFS